MFHSLEKSLMIESVNLAKQEFRKLIKEIKFILNEFVTRKGKPINLIWVISPTRKKSEKGDAGSLQGHPGVLGLSKEFLGDDPGLSNLV